MYAYVLSRLTGKYAGLLIPLCPLDRLHPVLGHQLLVGFRVVRLAGHPPRRLPRQFEAMYGGTKFW